MLTEFCCRAEDKAILEEAYLKNSKPDKAARLELLSRVSMHNEKAVQVSPAPVRMGLASQLRDASQCRLNSANRVSRSGSRTAARTTAGNHAHGRPKP